MWVVGSLNGVLFSEGPRGSFAKSPQQFVISHVLGSISRRYSKFVFLAGVRTTYQKRTNDLYIRSLCHDAPPEWRVAEHISHIHVRSRVKQSLYDIFALISCSEMERRPALVHIGSIYVRSIRNQIAHHLRISIFGEDSVHEWSSSVLIETVYVTISQQTCQCWEILPVDGGDDLVAHPRLSTCFSIDNTLCDPIEGMLPFIKTAA